MCIRDSYGSEAERGYFSDKEYMLKVLALCMGTGGKKRRKDFIFAKQAVGMISYFFDSSFAPEYSYRFDTAPAVSYTHLDVYKRQREGRALIPILLISMSFLAENLNPEKAALIP